MSDHQSTVDPRAALASVAGLGVVGLGLLTLEVATGLVPSCPFLALTGWYCPLCGSTRMGVSLLHGDLARAFWWNPLVFTTAVVLAVCSVLWIAEVLGQRAWRPWRLGGGPDQATWYRWALAAALVFTVVRNLA